jgi:hypothetical protein
LKYFKDANSTDRYERLEFRYNCAAGGIAGAVAAAVTNAFEAVTVAKQTNPDSNLKELISKEGSGLMTKGITARVAYNGA